MKDLVIPIFRQKVQPDAFRLVCHELLSPAAQYRELLRCHRGGYEITLLLRSKAGVGKRFECDAAAGECNPSGPVFGARLP